MEDSRRTLKAEEEAWVGRALTGVSAPPPFSAVSDPLPPPLLSQTIAHGFPAASAWPVRSLSASLSQVLSPTSSTAPSRLSCGHSWTSFGSPDPIMTGRVHDARSPRLALRG